MTRLFVYFSLLAALSLTTGCTLDELKEDIAANSRTANRYGSNYTKKKKETARPRVSPVKKNEFVLAQANKSNTRVVIDISKQKGYLLVNEKKGAEFPVSTARSGKYTPRGSFRITERVRSGKHSTIYGVEMPYWMRLSGTVFGVHAGYLPGYPASAGCIRLPAEGAQIVYDNTRNGTSVKVVSSWTGS